MIQFLYFLFLLLIPFFSSTATASTTSPRPRFPLYDRDVPGCTSSNTTAPAWSSNANYPLSTLVSYQSSLYQCLQAHHSQPDWAPPIVPALWAIPTPCGTTAWRIQTIYKIGSVVTYAGFSYTAIQGHVSLPGWEPVNAPALWGVGRTIPPGNVCPAGKTDCAGTACCGAGETCIASGFQKGLCCAAASMCGPLCCLSATDQCVTEPVRGFSCCPPGSGCGVSPGDPQRPCLACFPRGNGTL